MIREIDPAFWARIKAKAAVEHISVKTLVFALLTAWLRGKVTISEEKRIARIATSTTVVDGTGKGR
jgi:hypothetical protein